MMHLAGSTSVGRIIALSLLGMKREHAQQTLKLDDVLHTIDVLSTTEDKRKPNLDEIRNLLQGKGDKNIKEQEIRTTEKQQKVEKSRLAFTVRKPHKPDDGITLSKPVVKGAAQVGLPASHGKELGTSESQKSDVRYDKGFIQTSLLRSDTASSIFEPKEPEVLETMSTEKLDISGLFAMISSVSDPAERKELAKNVIVCTLKRRESKKQITVGKMTIGLHKEIKVAKTKQIKQVCNV